MTNERTDPVPVIVSMTRSSSSKHVTVSLNVHTNNNEEARMSQITKTARSIMLLAAGTVASVRDAGFFLAGPGAEALEPVLAA